MNARTHAALRSTALATAVVSIALTAGCGDDNKTIIEDGIPVDVQVSSDTVTSGSRIEVSADAASTGGTLTYAWTAAAGSFSDPAAQTTMWLAPEEEGIFSLTCVVADSVNAGLGAANVTVDLYAPTDIPAYSGAERCSGCHATEGQPGGDQYNPWLTSHHADAYATLLDIGQNENSACLDCHTVGTRGMIADPDLDNGGYDDTAVERLRDVQCENCHGAGGQHPNPDFGSVTVSLEAGICGNCHRDEHHPTFEEWQTSGHSMPIGFAAGLLGITRQTLIYRIRKHNLDWRTGAAHQEETQAP